MSAEIKTETEFKVGQRVKRVRDAYNTELHLETIGMTGTIKYVMKKENPVMYDIHFPDQYKETVFEGTLTRIPHDDLEPVTDEPSRRS